MAARCGDSHGLRPSTAPSPQQRPPSAAFQQRAATPTPPSSPVRSAAGSLLRSLRTSSGSLTGLLKGSRASPAPGPVFEIRGAAMLEPQRPKAASPVPAASGDAPAAVRHHTAAPAQQQQQQQQPMQGQPMQGQQGQQRQAPPVFNIAVRAGGTGQPRPSSARPGSAGASRRWGAVATHGIDLGADCPPGSSKQVQQQQQPAAGPGPAVAGASPFTHQNPLFGFNSSGAYGGDSFTGRFPSRPATPTSWTTGSGGPATPVAPAAVGLSVSTATTAPASSTAPSSCSGTPHAVLQVRAAQHAAALHANVYAAAAAVPLSQACQAPSFSLTLLARVRCPFPQAASNLTLINDSRPMSPGPFLSAYGSGAAPEAYSRPFTPAVFAPDSQPPTPVHGGAGAAADRAEGEAANPFAAGPPAFRALSPIKTLSAAARELAAKGSLPGLPHTAPTAPSSSFPSAAAAAVAAARAAAAAAACSREAAAVSAGREAPAAPAPGAAAATLAANAAAYRVPIFNQDGRLVGYKQSSNTLRPATSPGSTSRTLADSAAAARDQAPATAAAQSAPAASAPSAAPAALEAAAAIAHITDPEFADSAALPARGFPDADNAIPGYVLGPVLGKGGFCSVHKALHLLSGRTVAVKIIEKGRLKDPKDRDRVDREVRVMRNLSNHVCVVRLFECVETPNYVYLAMEHCTKGSLLDYVRDKKKLPEPEAAILLQQLLHALQFCHRKDVVHRDVKLENILLDWAGNAKLIDFGLCGYYVAGKRLRCHCGSPSYAAPEIVARKDYLGPPVDVWSLGVVLFAMLAGYLPFHAKEKKQLSEKIMAGVYKTPAWMSAEAADLLSRMLCLDPAARITLEEVWCHPWVTRWGTWDALGVGPAGLARARSDGATGALLPEEPVLAPLEAAGLDVTAVCRALRHREWSSLTATYHLLYEGWLEAQARLGLERSANDKASSSVWQWDFSSLVRPASAAPAPAAAVVSGDTAGALAGRDGDVSSSSGSAAPPPIAANNAVPMRSPVRPRTAGPGASGSPSRFQQEALAAEALAAGGGAVAAGRGVPAPVGQTDKQPVQPSAVEHEGFVIRAVHASPRGALPLDVEAGLPSPTDTSGSPPLLHAKQLQVDALSAPVLAAAAAAGASPPAW
eukprot:scaffold1.g5827.t1